MRAEFPYPCTRCGFCCIAETCPEGLRAFAPEPGERCPGFLLGDEVASCSLASTGLIGVGAGCCMSAEVYSEGFPYDFAALPPGAKRALALRAGGGDIEVRHRERRCC